MNKDYNIYPSNQTQRIECFLHDLNYQLRILTRKQEDVTTISMILIKEFCKFFSMPITDQKSDDGFEHQVTHIKKLIRDFELISTDSHLFTTFNQQKLEKPNYLQAFEQLYKNDVFEKSLFLFSKVKESFEKVNTFFGKLKNIKPRNSDMNKCISNGIRDKINNLNRIQTE
ncbi:uncharacterized protein LOC119600672 [Lucilia sericata]|uniref:uncharacterized protein LOC119600672 n=1 Tax=Lucilia sericata TaxID=13632 RepID=UPI0018A87DE3|nr:uncharacterized protein LOC119600672 [Lucilia sericata]